MNVTHQTRISSVLSAALVLLFAAPSQAALIQVTMTGLTDNTFVGRGDPCGTGLSGGNACNSQTIVINVQIDTGAAPADTNAANNLGNYRKTTVPGFLSASATINGRLFSLPGDAGFDHVVDIYDNLDGGGLGILDRVQFGIVGPNATDSFSAAPNLLMTSGAFAGDGLDVLAGVVGSPLAVSGPLSLSNGSFNVGNGTGQVSGQYRLSQVAFSAVPAPPAVWLLGTALAGLVGRRWQQGAGRG